MTQPASSYVAASDRYDRFAYRPVGRSGLKLPPLSLGLWHNFGNDTPLDRQREILRTAFDLGITHFDLANNYGTPYGSAESNFGRLLKEDFHAHRDELIISTKAGWDMWPGPYGQGGGSRKYVLASLDQSLRRMGLDYVDIFYSHRFDPETPMEETASALATAVQQGKALYVGVSAYSPEHTLEFAALLRRWQVPLLIHQPSYSIFNRTIEGGLFQAVEQAGAGMIAFSPLAQGLLTDRYLQGIPADSRVGRGTRFLRPENVSEVVVEKASALNEIAKARGQSLAQMAIAWVLRDRRMTSTIIGASSAAQVRENLGALNQLSFSSEELAAIDRIAPGPV
ncbi:L-glyceraldehyde 3-phosphate reductase [Steroidobacter sp. S1-65]|uniref:L-glyceraldehyde 3-phosphate reductase n=1 Tax=Steroidobacter gossypii TaxID=2805490 RepID=A0ABS1WWM4_9GAMM|nr:L-glyceraldehyde 3-phosphate reductase [Steroidobacter gossypii]MBM0105363.1 L-glyceraldehyde 3-phosphate reductase [Steroidobacter gossypii]